MSTVHGIENELYRRSLKNTKDPINVQELNTFRENISSYANDRSINILKRYYNHPMRKQLNQDYFKQVNSSLDAIFGIDIEANKALRIEELRLVNEYRELVNQLSFEFEGKRYLFKDSEQLFADHDPLRRAAAWNARKDEFVRIKDILHDKLHTLCKLRVEQAGNAGFEHFYDYDQRTGNSGSLDFKSMQTALSALKKHLKPIQALINKQWQKSLKQNKLAPCDCVAHPDSKGLFPFESAEDLVRKTIHILYDIRFEYGILLNKMWNTGLLDLEYEPDKAGGEYFFGDEQYGSCSIMMNCTGTHKDMVMFFHEIGHVLQLTALMKSPLYSFLSLPLDVREVSSQALVYLSTSAWADFYSDKKTLVKAISHQYRHDVIQLAESVCNMLFELDMYSNLQWSSQEREAAYLRYYKELFPQYRDEDMDEYIAAKWLLDIAVYEYPFYDFNTSISLFAVWQIMKVFEKDKDEAATRFHMFLGKASEFDIQQLYEILGLKYDFSDSHIKSILEQIRKVLK
jgi:oligoendopeptidase F